MLLMALLHQVVMNIWMQSFDKCERLFISSNTTWQQCVSGKALVAGCKLIYSMQHRDPEWGLPDINVLRQLAYGNEMRMERIVSHIL